MGERPIFALSCSSMRARRRAWKAMSDVEGHSSATCLEGVYLAVNVRELAADGALTDGHGVRMVRRLPKEETG